MRAYGHGRRRRPWYDFRVRAFFRLMRGRWTAQMPKLFRMISVVCGFVSGAALAVNTAMEVGHANGLPVRKEKNKKQQYETDQNTQ